MANPPVGLRHNQKWKDHVSERKITSTLSQRLDSAAADELVDVVIELAPMGDPQSSAPHSEKISARKTRFLADIEPVEKLIADHGGEVVGRAWINKTLHARIPAKAVYSLTQADEIASIDLPRQMARG